MTNEDRYVVRPLIRWFKRQRAQWKVKTPNYSTSAKGWDIEARRKNSDLLIEAKYIGGAFAPSFAALAAAPLVNRPSRFMQRKYRGWASRVCWAIGTNYSEPHLYQILLDYLSRNPRFWTYYVQTLRLKYVFFVRDGRVARARFNSILSIAKRYARLADDPKRRRPFDRVHRERLAGHLMWEILKYE